MTTLHEIAKRARVDILSAVEDGVKDLVLTPGLGNGIERVVEALRDALGAYEALAQSAHHSSSVLYALKDLPLDEKRTYEKTKHLLGVLDALYGIKDA